MNKYLFTFQVAGSVPMAAFESTGSVPMVAFEPTGSVPVAGPVGIEM